MTDALVRLFAARAPGVADLADLARLVRDASPFVAGVAVRPGDLPWGRYLLAAEAGWNLQLDVFSAAYTGGVHAHGTWGAFWVLRGALWSERYADDGARLTGAGWVPEGGCDAFCPPASDWHRVGTPAHGPQTVSVHLYGPGFDLDTGLALGPDGAPRAYRRGPWGDPAAVAGALVPR